MGYTIAATIWPTGRAHSSVGSWGSDPIGAVHVDGHGAHGRVTIQSDCPDHLEQLAGELLKAARGMRDGQVAA